MTQPPPLLLGGAVGASILAISTAAVLVRSAEAPPLVVAFWRLAYATALLALPAWFLAREDLRRLSRGDLGRLAAIGAALAVHFATWITSLGLTTVAASVFLVTLHPVFVAVASERLFGEGPGRVGYVGIAAALLGGLLITAAAAGEGPAPLRGNLLALAGAAAAAAYFLAGRGYRRRMGLLAYVVPVYGSATLLLAILTAAVPPPYGGPFLGYAWAQHALFLALAVVPMLLGHTILNWALRFLPAPVVATTVLGEPVGASLLAYAFLHEIPGPGTLGGGLLVLAGIAAVAASGARRLPPARGSSSG